MNPKRFWNKSLAGTATADSPMQHSYVFFGIALRESTLLDVEKTKQFLQLRDLLRKSNRLDALRQLDETIGEIQQRSISWLQLKAFSGERGTDSGFHSCPKGASSETFWNLEDQPNPVIPPK
ncbi:unnamed protein product [Dibothriocephalus latus]|uniref:Uncharacterized protein n=1 Tax=Dibothriocephalus latus TaxID=60516 RepID=A0A3P6SGB3_DIBLA|nr:unnamed protein product [Dibothriocephalus latus]